jgi:Holliday junction resolvasome RuvABC endonuclease subunit
MASLYVDIGTYTGWAILSNNEIYSGVEKLSTNKKNKPGLKYLKFKNWLDKVYENYKIDKVFYEEVIGHKGVYAAHVYGGLVSHLMSWAEDKNIPYVGVHVAKIKKYATCKGNANKEEMIKYVNSKGFNVIDNNEADAISLMLYVNNR